MNTCTRFFWAHIQEWISWPLGCTTWLCRFAAHSRLRGFPSLCILVSYTWCHRGAPASHYGCYFAFHWLTASPNVIWLLATGLTYEALVLLHAIFKHQIVHLPSLLSCNKLRTALEHGKQSLTVAYFSREVNFLIFFILTLWLQTVDSPFLFQNLWRPIKSQ